MLTDQTGKKPRVLAIIIATAALLMTGCTENKDDDKPSQLNTASTPTSRLADFTPNAEMPSRESDIQRLAPVAQHLAENELNNRIRSANKHFVVPVFSWLRSLAFFNAGLNPSLGQWLQNDWGYESDPNSFSLDVAALSRQLAEDHAISNVLFGKQDHPVRNDFLGYINNELQAALQPLPLDDSDCGIDTVPVTQWQRGASATYPFSYCTEGDLLYLADAHRATVNFDFNGLNPKEVTGYFHKKDNPGDYFSGNPSAIGSLDAIEITANTSSTTVADVEVTEVISADGKLGLLLLSGESFVDKMQLNDSNALPNGFLQRVAESLQPSPSTQTITIPTAWLDSHASLWQITAATLSSNQESVNIGKLLTEDDDEDLMSGINPQFQYLQSEATETRVRSEITPHQWTFQSEGISLLNGRELPEPPPCFSCSGFGGTSGIFLTVTGSGGSSSFRSPSQYEFNCFTKPIAINVQPFALVLWERTTKTPLYIAAVGELVGNYVHYDKVCAERPMPSNWHYNLF